MAKILGATNIVSVGRRTFSPASTVQMIAKQGWLSNTWNLYTIRKRPMMPRCNGRTICQPVTEKIASGVSLSEVFNHMRKHEELGQGSMPEDSRAVPENRMVKDSTGSIAAILEALSPSENIIPDKQSNKSEIFDARLNLKPIKEQYVPSDDRRYWRNVKERMAL